jgi:hypothetical protein
MKMKKTITIVLVLGFLAVAGLASAKAKAQNDNGQLKQKVEKEREIMRLQWEKNKETFKATREKIKSEVQMRLEEKKKLRAEWKEKFTEERCARITARVQNRTSHYDQKETAHAKVYTNLVNRLNKFLTRFKTAGLDTAKLEGFLAELKTKIDKFKSDYAAYIAKLKESKSLTCGYAEGEFRAIMVDAKALLKTVHTDAAEIRTYVRTVIFPELKVLKSQMPKVTDDTDENDDDED